MFDILKSAIEGAKQGVADMQAEKRRERKKIRDHEMELSERFGAEAEAALAETGPDDYYADKLELYYRHRNAALRMDHEDRAKERRRKNWQKHCETLAAEEMSRYII